MFSLYILESYRWYHVCLSIKLPYVVGVGVDSDSRTATLPAKQSTEAYLTFTRLSPT